MAHGAIKALRDAAVVALRADATLGGLALAVHEYGMETQAHPYVLVSTASADQNNNVAKKRVRMQLTIDVRTRDKSSAKCFDIMNHIYTLLDNAALSVTGFTLIFLRYLESDLVQARAPESFSGRMQFLAELE